MAQASSSSDSASLQNHLNAHSAAILVVFVIVSFFVIWPIKIPLLPVVQRNFLWLLRTTRVIDPTTADGLSRRRLHFPLSLETAPVIGVLFLLATTTVTGSTIVLGVKGDENVKPYDVLVLFISLAYIAIALDGTGALEAVAFWVSRRGGSSGPRLFAYLYAFFLLTGCIVGNDPLILSGTPFLAYLTRYTGLEPTPWIFSEFMAANTASAVLVSSNPTNILITGSFGLNYLSDFTKWTVLPSIIPGVLNYFVLYVMFRNRIPKTLTPLKDDPWTKLRDPRGALFLSVLMLVTISVLVGTSFVPGHAVQVWMVTAPAGALALSYEVISDLLNPELQRRIVNYETLDPAAEMTTIFRKSSLSDEPPQPVQVTDSTVKSEADNIDTNTNTQVDVVTKSNDDTVNQNLTQRRPSDASSTPPPPPLAPLPPPSKPTTTTTTKTSQERQNLATPHHTTLEIYLRNLTNRLPRTTRTLSLLPLPLLPFAISEFILVRSLSQRGWINLLARGCTHATPTPITSIFFFGALSAALLCPFAGTNIGATILLVEVLRDPAYTSSPRVQSDPRILRGAIYATAMGSNLGAFSYVFAASLAGLLWRKLLADKGVIVKQRRFFVVNLGPLVLQVAVACAVLCAQVYWF